MRFKKSIIILSLIIILLSITTVSAIDSDDAQVSKDNSQILEKVDENAVTSSQEYTLNSSTKGTFTALQEIITAAPDGSTINLDKDYSYDKAISVLKGKECMTATNTITEKYSDCEKVISYLRYCAELSLKNVKDKIIK